MLATILSKYPEAKIFLYLVGITLLLGLLFLNKISKNRIMGFRKAEINDRVKTALVVIQSAGSLLLAFILPNNYLNTFDSIRRMYEENQMWIPVSMIVLLLFFMALFGAVFTFLTQRFVSKLR